MRNRDRQRIDPRGLSLVDATDHVSNGLTQP